MKPVFYGHNMFKDEQRERAYRRGYYQKNKDKILSRAKNWNKQNPEKVNANRRAFFEKHPDYWRKNDAK